MIKWIEITNFKSIQADKIFLPQMGAIVGNNSAGKTNLLQAVGLIKRLATGENIKIAARGYVLSPDELFNINVPSREFHIKISLSDNEEQEYLLEVSFFNTEDPKLPVTIQNEKLLKSTSDRETFELVYERKNNNLENKNRVNIPLSIDTDKLALSLYKNPDAQAVRSIFSKVHLPDMEFKSLRESLTTPTDDNIARFLVQLKTEQEESYKIFQTIIKKLLPSFSNIIEVLPKALRASDERKMYLVLLEEKNLKTALSMQTVSLGDLRTLFILTVTLLAKEHSTIFFEEIENALHPKRVKDVIEFLENIARKKDIQLLYTTHSPTVINRLRPSEILFTRKDENKGTKYILLDNPRNISAIESILNSGGEITEFIYS